jgi:hypothetical protein
MEDESILRIKDDLDFSPDDGSTYYSIYHEGNFGKTEIDNLNIDADTVDTLHASSFLRSDTDDEATGRITLSNNSDWPLKLTGSSDSKIWLGGATDPYIEFFQGESTDAALIKWDSSGSFIIRNIIAGAWLRVKDDLDFSSDNGSTYYSIYHEGNLTAAVIDGLSGIDTYFSPVGHTHTESDITDLTKEQGGVKALGSGVSSVTVTFTTDGEFNMPDTSYKIDCTFENTTDATPSQYGYIVTAKSTSAFTVQLSGVTDTSNYVMNWSVRDV